MNDKKPWPCFALGKVVATPGASEALQLNKQTPLEFLQRHVVLDPGDLNEEDQQTNEDTVTNGE